MSNVTLNSIPSMSVEKLVGELTKMYSAVITGGHPIGCLPSVMLWAAPGTGKSQAVRQIARGITEATGKKTAVTDVRLLLFNPIDLRGIPTANEDKTLAVWLRPQIFQMDPSPDVVNLLFLDEISAAPQSVQAAAYQITLDRTVGEHRLPDNCIVIAAGNRVTDRSVAFTMPKALANRLCHIEIVSDERSWHSWAVGAGVNSLVLAFLDYHPELLMRFDPTADGVSFPTPRSWEMVSNMLNHVSKSIAEIYPLIVGCIGEDAAYELRAFSEIYSKIPRMADIFNGSYKEIPTRPEILFALSAGIATYARMHFRAEEIRNAVEYASHLPTEFRNRIFTDLLKIKEIRALLSEIRVYDDWFARSGRYWEDYGVQ